MAFEDKFIPAETSDIFGFLSNITEEIFFLERQIPAVRPEMPAPMMEILLGKLAMLISSAQACFAFAHGVC